VETDDVAYFHVVACQFGAPDRLDEWQDWYDNVHVPALLAVPGMRSVRRYDERGTSDKFLAIWEIDGPHVFDEPAYQAAKGFGSWEPFVKEWTISLLERHGPERRFPIRT
jgi:hypothetical protein